MKIQRAIHPVELRPEQWGSTGPLLVEVSVPMVWLVRTAGLWTLAEDRASVLDAGERRKAAAFRQPGDRRTYIASHVALRLLLGRCLELAPQAVPLVRLACPTCGGPHGRPAVAGQPVHFSISHSADLALLALAPVPVGVDVQELPAPEVADEIVPMMHPREVAELAGYDRHELPRAFADTWARKEAYLKALGTGLSRGLATDYIGTAQSPEPPAGWRIEDLSVGAGHAAAVAVRDVPDSGELPAPGGASGKLPHRFLGAAGGQRDDPEVTPRRRPLGVRR